MEAAAFWELHFPSYKEQGLYRFVTVHGMGTIMPYVMSGSRSLRNIHLLAGCKGLQCPKKGWSYNMGEVGDANYVEEGWPSTRNAWPEQLCD